MTVAKRTARNPARRRVNILVVALAGAVLCGLMAALAQQATSVSPPVLPSCAPAPAPVVFSSASPVVIPETGLATSPITVSGLGNQAIVDIDVRTNIRHTSPADLDIEVVAPTGNRITLSSDNGGANPDVFNGTLWDNAANPAGRAPYDANPGLATDHPYAPGVAVPTLAPEEGLVGPVNGMADGVWSLAVEDFVAGNAGSIDSWSLTFTLRSGISLQSSFLQVDRTNATPVLIGVGAPSIVTSTIDVSSTTTNYISAAPVVTTNIAHTRSDDLDVTLTSPAGTSVTLTTDNGNGAADVFAGTRWIDTAGPANLRVTDLAYGGGAVPTLVPEEPLSAFVGEDPVGSWTLTVSDDAALEGGTLVSWGLSFPSVACNPNLSLQVTSPPANLRIGQPVILDISATLGPQTAARNLEISALLSHRSRFVRLVPSEGGACTAPPLDAAAGFVKCVWAGPTPVGTTRTARLVTRPFVSGFSTVQIHAGTSLTRQLAVAVQKLDIFARASSVRAANGQRCTILGTQEPDVIVVPRLLNLNRGAVICGLGGDDRLTGGGRVDTIDGGPGNDVIAGSSGHDRLFGGPGRDNMSGGPGNDLLHGGPGTDGLRGGPGRDTAVGPTGDALISIERRS